MAGHFVARRMPQARTAQPIAPKTVTFLWPVYCYEVVMNSGPQITGPTFDQDHRFLDAAASSPPHRRTEFWGKDGLRFSDLIDTINPLQHIPIVSSIYRKMTGDELAPGARIAGGSLFGGPVGFLSGLIDSVIEGATGQDIGGYVLGLLPGGNVPSTAAGLNMAAAGPAPADTPAPAGAEQTVHTSAALPANGNALALAALERDLRLTARAVRPTPYQLDPAKSASAAEEATRSSLPALPAGQARQSIFAVPLAPTSGAAAGPTQGDGRKAGEYSAAELASILRAYKRASDVAALPEIARTSRVED